MGKFGQKTRLTGLSQAGRPGTSKNSVLSSIQWQSNTPTMPLSQGLDVSLIKWIERLAQGLKDAPFSANPCPGQQSSTQGRSQVY